MKNASLIRNLDSLGRALEVGVTSSTRDNVLDHPYLGLFNDSAEFWATYLSAHGAFNDNDRADAHAKIYGPGGYVSRASQAFTKSATGQNEAQDSDGGVLVIPHVAEGMLQSELEMSNFATRCFPIPTFSPVCHVNALVDKDHSSTVAGGISVTRKMEGISPDKSQGEFEKITLKCTKQLGYTDITEELSSDARGVGTVIPAMFARAYAAEDEREFLYQGTGFGEPLAALHANNPSLITIDKETSQAADTIVTENLVKMRSRCYDYGASFWVSNQDAVPQLLTLSTSNGQPVYVPGGLDGRGDTILGRPVLYSEYAAALGDINDIGLVSPKHYGVAVREATKGVASIHVRFLQGETTLRFVKRNDGQPLWKSALTPVNGSTRSPFVNLAAR